MSSTKSIKQFILNLAEKNFSQANTSLQEVVENKLKEKIKNSVAKKNSNNLDK